MLIKKFYEILNEALNDTNNNIMICNDHHNYGNEYFINIEKKMAHTINWFPKSYESAFLHIKHSLLLRVGNR